MSNRLDQEREAKLQPIRMRTCQETLEKLGYEVEVANHTLLIIHHPSRIDIQLFLIQVGGAVKRLVAIEDSGNS